MNTRLIPNRNLNKKSDALRWKETSGFGHSARPDLHCLLFGYNLILMVIGDIIDDKALARENAEKFIFPGGHKFLTSGVWPDKASQKKDIKFRPSPILHGPYGFPNIPESGNHLTSGSQVSALSPSAICKVLEHGG